MIPSWFHALALASLSLGGLCAFIIAFDELRHPQHMWIMDVVWPLVALFGSVVVLWLYFGYGRLATHEKAAAAQAKGQEPPSECKTPFPIMVAKGTLHCGAGCTLGDIIAEWLAVLAPAVAVAFGFGSLFPEKLYAVWIVDYLFAFALGIAFQYFTIVPMRHLPPGKGIVQALKADSLSLTFWQFGMYGFMAFAILYIYPQFFGAKVEASMAEFWFAMQFAMLVGFITAYPANWWLIRSGIKEKM